MHSTERTLIFGGTVITQNRQRETHEAMVLKDGKVEATGTLDEMRSLAGVAARTIDVDGACVIPGLIDNHPHAMHFGSFDAGCVKLYDATSHDDILTRIKDRVRQSQAGDWILTTPVGEPHYFIRRSWRNLAEGRLPNRYELDAVAPDHPVLIQAYAPVTPNVCAMNSRALAMVGIDRSFPDVVDDVHVEKDDRGEPTGILTGRVTNYYNSSPFFLGRIMGPIFASADADFWYRGGLAGQIRMASRGITGLYEGHAMEASNIAAYQRMRDEGRLALRVMASVEFAPSALDMGHGLSPELMRENLALARQLKQASDPQFRVDGLTLSTGGAIWPGYLRLGRPYSDPFGRPTDGFSPIPVHMLREAIEYSLKNDLRLNNIACGHVDHREFFDIVDPYLADWDVKGREWVTQHNIFIDDANIQRYADLGFHFTTTSSFCWGKAAMYEERAGSETLKDLTPMAKLFASGANVGFGSDWGPANPFEHMALSQTGEIGGTSGRRIDNPGYAISRQQAFDGWTVNNARLMQWKEIGALVPGSHADFSIVDRNPLTVDLADLPGTQILKTALGGRDIYDTGVFARLDDAPLEPERTDPGRSSHRAQKGHVCSQGCWHG